MKHLLVIGFILSLSCNIYGQINMEDSTAQVVAYFNNNEKQTYSVQEEKYKVKGSDTTERQFVNYTVDIVIIDSTADSYIIDWHYKDFQITTDDEIMKKLNSINKDITVRIRTNELGVFQEVINWKEIRDYISKQTKTVAKDIEGIPNIKKLVKQIEASYSTKEAIEASSVVEIVQFFTFHGSKYEYGVQYNEDMKVPNLLGGEPFDAKVTYWLDELNPDDNNIVLRMSQTVDSVQLTDESYKFVAKMAETMKVAPPTREEIPMITNETYKAARIHGSGWPIYSILTNVTKAEGTTRIEERIIEII